MIVDRHGTPLAVSLTGGNRHDITQLIPLLDAIPRIRGVRGRPRNRPKRLFADRGYDYDKYRHLLRKRGVRPLIARRGVAHGSGLGRTRWVPPGSISSNDSVSAMSNEPTSTRDYSNSPAASSAFDGSACHSEMISKNL